MDALDLGTLRLPFRSAPSVKLVPCARPLQPHPVNEQHASGPSTAHAKWFTATSPPHLFFRRKSAFYYSEIKLHS